MIRCDTYYIWESVFAPKTNLKTCAFCCNTRILALFDAS